MGLFSWLGGKSSSEKSSAFGSKRAAGNSVYIPDRMGRLDQGTWMGTEELRDPFGRLDAMSGKQFDTDSRKFGAPDGSALVGPVGLSGENRPEDVAKVEAPCSV